MIIKYLLIIFMIVSFPAALLSQEEEEEEENPHVEMVDDEFVCLDCHTDVPKKGQTSPTYFLVDLPSENCLGCHDETQHTGAKEHEGQKVEVENLPGDENGNIACFTCHDPHPEGVIEGRTVYDAVLSERSKQFIEFIVVPNLTEELGQEIKPEFAEAEVYLREPSNEICINCHKAPIKKDWRNYPPWNKFTDMYTY
jgi:hypothetical protein